MKTTLHRLIGVQACLFTGLLACQGDDPGVSTDPSSESDGPGDGDGDGDPGDGDPGDGDPGDGDGDGEGDGDGDSGDGDGDPCSDPDQDQDGHEAEACGGLDCNDGDPTIHPGAPDFNVEPEIVALGLPLGIGQNPLNISLDAQGVVHIGYAHNQDMFHAWQVGNGWQVASMATGRDQTILARQDGVIEAVSIQAVGASALRHGVYDGAPILTFPDNILPALLNPGHAFALGPNDVPHVALGDGTNEDLRYSTRPALVWAPELVDPEGGSYAALALGPEAEPHIFYLATDTFTIRHARREGNGWTITDVDSTNGTIIPSLAVAADGAAFAAWSGLNLTIANDRSGPWTVEEVPNTAITGANDIAIASDGTVYVAFERYDGQGQMTSISLVHDRDGSWTERELLPPYHRAVSLAIADGWIHVALVDVSAGQVLYFGLPVADGIDQDCNGDEW